MPTTRIYHPGTLQTNNVVSLDNRASHHLMHVLRAKVNDAIVLFNGEGGEYEAEIKTLSKKGVEVIVKAFNARDVESPIQTTLAQGIARGEKMDFIIQKAVELGVTHIVPLITERCNVKLSPEREAKRLAHWEGVVISACEQSGRTRLPTLTSPQSLRDWLPTNQADLSLVLSPHVTETLPKDKTPGSITLLIGPEGGLSEEEIKLALQHHFQSLQLGPRVLRTETAPLAALVALQLQFGDFSA